MFPTDSPNPRECSTSLKSPSSLSWNLIAVKFLAISSEVAAPSRHCSCLALVNLHGVHTCFRHELPDFLQFPVRGRVMMFVHKIPALLHLVLVHHHAESHMLHTVFQQLVPLDWVPWHAKQSPQVRKRFGPKRVPTSNLGSSFSKVCHAFSRCNFLFKL